MLSFSELKGFPDAMTLALAGLDFRAGLRAVRLGPAERRRAVLHAGHGLDDRRTQILIEFAHKVVNVHPGGPQMNVMPGRCFHVSIVAGLQK